MGSVQISRGNDDMNRCDHLFSTFDEERRKIALLITLLPPPVSIDMLCDISRCPPVKILQMTERLTKIKYLSRHEQKGVGHYVVSDSETASQFLKAIPEKELFDTAKQAVEGISSSMPDAPQRWLHIAHIHHVSGLPVTQYKEVIKAGHYCRERHLEKDAATYYTLALKALTKADLDDEEQRCYIDAAIGVCTCNNNAISPATQKTYLQRAVSFHTMDEDAARKIQLITLMARALTRLGQYQEATQEFENAWRIAEQNDLPQSVRLQIALANAEFLFWQGMIEKAIQCYESVIDSREELPGDIETLKMCATQAWVYGIAGQSARGLGLAEAIRNKSKELGSKDLELFATLMMVCILVDARRMDEAQRYLDEVFAAPQFFLNDYLLWPGNGKRAFIAYWNGDYDLAFEYQHQAYTHSVALGFVHHRGPDNLELMLALEARGLVHPQWNFENEVKRLLVWPDIYMKGVALRFRALQSIQKGASAPSAKSDLESSIALLTRAGARIERSHAQVLLAKMLLQENDTDGALELLQPAWDTLSKVNEALFPKDLRKHLPHAAQSTLWVDSLVKVDNAIGLLRERKQLLSEIIKQAMRIVNAERGIVFLKKDGLPEIAATRNIETETIAAQAFSDAMATISLVMNEGHECYRGAGRASGLDSRAMVNEFACFPIRRKAEIMGSIYLDCRISHLLLSDDELALLRIISNQAAIALENLETYEDINEQKEMLAAEANYYRNIMGADSSMKAMIGQSKPFKKILHLIDRVAASDTTVMITGETGVGKDLAARAIHEASLCSNGPFIAVNLMSLSSELLASELFGHEKGAFTGATQRRKGRFELAAGGTLFLDDIDACSLDIQARLLRVLETREFERVGGSETLITRFRLIAASNQDIETLVEKGLFRSDFYFRLNVFPIKLPPLRMRKEDIPLLAQHFLDRFGQKHGKPHLTISKNTMERLLNYPWPGNIRELGHLMERAVLLSHGPVLDIPLLGSTAGSVENPARRRMPTLDEMEAAHILEALAMCGGKVSGPGGAGELLKVKPTTLYSKMKRLGLHRTHLVKKM